MAYNSGKHLSGLHLIQALESLAVAYYYRSDKNTLEALQACRSEIERRLSEWSQFEEPQFEEPKE